MEDSYVCVHVLALGVTLDQPIAQINLATVAVECTHCVIAKLIFSYFYKHKKIYFSNNNKHKTPLIWHQNTLLNY